MEDISLYQIWIQNNRLGSCKYTKLIQKEMIDMNIIVGIMCALALGGGVFVWWIENGTNSEKNTPVADDKNIDEENDYQKEIVDKESVEAKKQEN